MKALHTPQRWHALLLLWLLTSLPLLAMAAPANRTLIAPDGVPIAVQESGNPQGRAIIFVHGLLGSHLSWDAQMHSPQLQHYRLISYDLRGHGQSGKPERAEAYRDGRRWADDLATVIAGTGAQRPLLVGWSLGAAVITNYLATYGDAHIAGALYVGAVIELQPDQIVAHPQLYRELTSPELRTQLNAERAFLALCFATPPAAETFQRLLANAALASPQMQSAVHGMSLDAAAGLGALRKPLLLIYGAQDALVQAGPSLARAQALKPLAMHKLYADAGHAPFLEQADRFNRDLAVFLESTR